MAVKIFEQMIGKTMSSVVVSDDKSEMAFTEIDGIDTPGGKHTFFHESDCCEVVRIEEIVGDLSDLEWYPIVGAEEVSSKEADAKRLPHPDPKFGTDEAEDNGNQCSYTWTFYRFSTSKGTVVVRWLGESNGCYSERAKYEGPIKTDEDNDY
jgi:hypothetical protein